MSGQPTVQLPERRAKLRERFGHHYQLGEMLAISVEAVDTNRPACNEFEGLSYELVIVIGHVG